MLSQRGTRKADQPLRPDIDLFREAEENAYGPDNPDGAITLCIAENLLQWPRLRDKLRRITAERAWPDWLAAYTELGGNPEFREAVATFVGEHIAGQQLDPANFCASAGATAVVEVSAMVAGDAGDYAVFPAPAYQAYAPDVANKAGLQRYDIRHYAAAFGTEYHPLSVRELDAAREQLGEKFRVLVLTQPDNPTGAVYSTEQLRTFADWCAAKQIHLVVNEIYALSQLDPAADGIRNEVPFTSFLPLIEDRDSPYLHWWYSFSKDFGLSGFRIGLLYSRNPQFRAAYTNYNAPHQVSNLTQWVVAQLLGERNFVVDFQTENRRLLTESYLTVARTLDKLGAPYTAARGSLFVWADLSGYLTERTQEAAEAWWKELFARTGVLLTAPGGLGQPDAGWYRIVYSGVPLPALEEAMARIERYLMP